MVTFTPRLSHVRFGQQQTSATPSASLPVSTLPPFAGNATGGDQATFSAPHPTHQLQFGKGFPGGRLGIAGAALGALLAVGIPTTLVATHSGSNGKADTSSSAPAVAGSSPADSSSASSGSVKPMSVEDLEKLLDKYKSDFQFPSTADLNKGKPADGKELTQKEKDIRLALKNKELPAFLQWLVIDNPSLINPGIKSALPPDQRWLTYFADPTSQAYLKILENRKELNTESLYPESPTMTKLGTLWPTGCSLGSSTESYFASYSSFQLKALWPQYDELTNKLKKDGKLATATDQADGQDNFVAQLSDFSKRNGSTVVEDNKAAAAALDNVGAIFKATGLKVLVADPEELAKGPLSDAEIKEIGKKGVVGKKNFVFYVDTGKLGGDPEAATVALATGITKAAES